MNASWTMHEEDRTLFFIRNVAALSRHTEVFFFGRILNSIIQSTEFTQLEAGSKEKLALEVTANDEELQSSLMHCASEIVNFAFCSKLRFPGLTFELRRGDELVRLWQAIGIFWAHMSESTYICLSPQSITDFLAFMRYMPRILLKSKSRASCLVLKL